MTKLKEALEKLLEAAHPAYVSDDHIADAGEMVSLRDQFAMQAMQGIASNGSAKGACALLTHRDHQ